MNVEKLFSDLSYGELSNLSLSADGTGTIVEEQQPKILHYANEALLRLHSKFLLREKDLLLELRTNVSTYRLLRKHALSQWDGTGTGQSFYIQDLGREQFAEDVIKIMDVYNIYGRKLPLNDIEDPHSLFTPVPHTLQVPHPELGAVLSVVYQARHEPLVFGQPAQEIELPDVLYPALTSFIAYKVHSHMNTLESTSKAQEHLAMFDLLCQETQDQDLVHTSISQSNTRFEKRGWA